MAILAVAAPLQADISLPSAPPPQPQPVKVKAYIGESIVVPLSGVTRSGSGLQFLLRKQPAMGKLSEIQQTGPNTATVTYTHDPHAGAGLDSFRYAVAAPGIGVSTPATVSVNIVERPSEFVAPARLDFPTVAVGKSSQQTLEIRNDGGGRIDGKLTLPAPWKIVGSDGSYSLGAGASQTFIILFAPVEARQFLATAEFSHAPGIELGLGGTAYAPIEIAPREIVLEADARNEARTGGFVLRNVSDEDRELRIVAPAEVIVQDTITLPAKSESQVALHTRAGFLGALDAWIAITGANVALKTPLRIAAAPARLSMTPNALDFGTLEAGRTGRENIKLHNAGGSPAQVTVKLPEGFAMDPDPSYQALAPGDSREIEVSCNRPLPGKFEGLIVLGTPESSLRLPVRVVVKPEWQSSGTLDGAAKSKREVPYSGIPPVDQLGVTRQTKTELDLAWKRTSPNISRYVLFMRTFAFDKGQSHFKYQELDRVKVRFVRNEARATLAGLRPGESVTLIIVGMDAAGTASRPSQPFTVATKPSPVFHFPWFWLGVAGIVAFAAVIVRERRRRRAVSNAEFAGIPQP